MRCFQQKAEQLPVRSIDEMQLLSEGVLPCSRVAISLMQIRNLNRNLLCFEDKRGGGSWGRRDTCRSHLTKRSRKFRSLLYEQNISEQYGVRQQLHEVCLFVKFQNLKNVYVSNADKVV